MKAWKLLLLIPVVAAIAMVPQDPPTSIANTNPEEVVIMSISELQYTNLQGAINVVSARNVVEIRLFEDLTEHVRLELLYENGDYSMIDSQGFHLLRNGSSTREVRLVRAKLAKMRFPRLL